MKKTKDETTTEDSESNNANNKKQNSTTDSKLDSTDKEEKPLTFDDDILGREKLCENLTASIFARLEKTKGTKENEEFKSYTLSLNGKYGTGKTWFLKMWKNLLETKYKDKCSAYYLNLWEDEYYTKPIISFSYAIMDLIKENDTKNTLFKLLADIDYKKSAKSSLKNFLKSKACIEIENQQGLFEDYKNLKTTFTNAKQAIQKEIAKNKKPLILMIDELDRVKPPHALEVLEVLKHFFNIEGLVFIFAVNREQIETSIKHHYGSDMDFDGYYRRFFSSEVELPSYLDKYIEIIQNNKHVSTSKERTRLAEHMAFFMLRFKYSLRDVNQFCDEFNARFSISGKKPLVAITSVALLVFVLHREKEHVQKELKKDLFNDMKNASTQEERKNINMMIYNISKKYELRWKTIISDIRKLFNNGLTKKEEIMLEEYIQYLIWILVASKTDKYSIPSIDVGKVRNEYSGPLTDSRLVVLREARSYVDADVKNNRGFMCQMQTSYEIIREICEAIESKRKFDKHIIET